MACRESECDRHGNAGSVEQAPDHRLHVRMVAVWPVFCEMAYDNGVAALQCPAEFETDEHPFHCIYLFGDVFYEENRIRGM